MSTCNGYPAVDQHRRRFFRLCGGDSLFRSDLVVFRQRGNLSNTESLPWA